MNIELALERLYQMWECQSEGRHYAYLCHLNQRIYYSNSHKSSSYGHNFTPIPIYLTDYLKLEELLNK